MSEEKIDKISKVTKDIQAEETKKPQTVPNRDHFEDLMNQGVADKQVNMEEKNIEEVAKQNTLMDEVRDANHSRIHSNLSPEGLVAQTQDVINKIDTLKQDLNTPNLELKGSVQNLLKNKLEHIDENLKIALTKVGTEYTPPEATSNVAKPIERFIGFLTHSQYQLDNLATDVRTMHLDNKTLSPASMLAVQIKVAYVQQELEFFTSLLNKALESTKTIMNVQV